MKCTNCAREIEQSVNFCPWCGVVIGDYETLPFKDIRITFLRADLSEFTTMSETMIAEDVMAFLNEVFGIFSKVIESYKGTLHQVIGDEVVSIFGLHKESGFAPHMAVLAAEEMFNKLFECNKKEYLKNPIGLKIGIEIEPATVYNIKDDLRNALIISDGFTKSQILQKNAENNTLLVGENLYQETKAFFGYREIGEFVKDNLAVKAYEYKLKLRA
jgi:class 3 adenylate cyclase